MMNLKIAELFAGIGGVTGGFLDAGGYESVYLNDLDAVAQEAFGTNFAALADRYHRGSVRHLTGPKLLEVAGGEIHGILGCPPCQGFSAAGKRLEDDQRNELLHDMRRLILSVEPLFFVMENVPGLLSTALYKRFIQALEPRYSIAASVVNAAEYGVPQLRRRAVIIGVHLDAGVAASLPLPTHGGTGRVFDYRTGKMVSPKSQVGRRDLMLRPDVALPDQPLVTLQEALSDLPHALEPGEESSVYDSEPTTAYQRLMRTRKSRLTHQRAWRHNPCMVQFMAGVRPGDCPASQGRRARNEEYFSQAYARLHHLGLARTITTNFHNPGSGRFTHYGAPRTLTIREALRIQGFPDSFQLEQATQTEAERLVGNAFPRPLARVLASHIRSLLADRA